MIEAIVAHIKDRGFQASVISEGLLIWKIVDGVRYNKVWYISFLEIALVRDVCVLTVEADRYMAKFPREVQS